MQERADQPLAVRATAFFRASRWRRRPVRMVRYDACWADGRVDYGVSLSKMMYRRAPADFAAIDDSVHAHCPEEGIGEWVDDLGRVVEGPSSTDQNPPAHLRGTPRKYGVSRYNSNPNLSRAWRLGGGVASLGVGTLLITGPMRDGVAGAAGLIFCIIGIAALAGLVPRKYRWW